MIEKLLKIDFFLKNTTVRATVPRTELFVLAFNQVRHEAFKKIGMIRGAELALMGYHV